MDIRKLSLTTQAQVKELLSQLATQTIQEGRFEDSILLVSWLKEAGETEKTEEPEEVEEEQPEPETVTDYSPFTREGRFTQEEVDIAACYIISIFNSGVAYYQAIGGRDVVEISSYHLCECFRKLCADLSPGYTELEAGSYPRWQGLFKRAVDVLIKQGTIYKISHKMYGKKYYEDVPEPVQESADEAHEVVTPPQEEVFPSELFSVPYSNGSRIVVNPS